MSQLPPVIRNWRETDPYVSHENAIIWAILTARDDDNKHPTACLEHISGFARHSVQGGKESDYHQHEDAEQFYYVLSGRGDVLIGDTRHPVRPGSVTYFPPKTPHQFFNTEEDEWCEHLIITCSVKREGSQQRVLNWRDVKPTAGQHGAAVTWHLLESVDEKETSTDQPCLLGFHYLAQQALTRGKASDNHKHDDKEQVYYIIEGNGTVLMDGDVYYVSEGDAVYLPRGAWHQIINEDYDGWFTYLVIS
jgi:mannose-6-phosphate isomerase-like protein (cupin superfamily)